MNGVLDRLKVALTDRYLIERELGAGGMATVYLAHDLKHDREVAIKMLRPELASAIGVDRFLREIKIAAKLNHPHILPLHDSGEADGLLFYVMPLVQGESLRVKLSRDMQLPVDEAISIARQVATALDYAHEQGIIHRDIKPENILLHQGEVLVADFGIALAVSAAGGTRLTNTGLSLGTAEYMSPEQATGERELDARSDVYSLGAVTYEMLVGEPPHLGSTVQAIIAKVLSAKPQSLTSIRHSLPSNVDAAVMTALAKTPADRFGSGAEFVEALTDPTFALPPAAGTVAMVHRHELQNRTMALTFAIAAIAAVLAVWGWCRSPSESVKHVTRVSFVVPEGEEFVRAQGTDIVLSPDGTRLVYVGPSREGHQLWVRRLDELHATPLQGTDGAMGPFFSPDGEAVAYHLGSPGSIKVVTIAGSPPVTLVDAVFGNSADWSSDGMLYFGAASGGISRVAAAGGDPDVVTTPDTAHGELLHNRVDVLPNGKGALFTIWRGTAGDADVAVVDLATRDVRTLVGGLDPQFAPSGHLVFVRSDGVLSAAPFDQDKLVLTGPPAPLVEGVSLKSGGAAQFALSETGTLLYVRGQQQREAVWVDRDGVERKLDAGWVDRMTYPALSPDDSRLAIAVDGADGRHIWIKTLDRGSLSRLTFRGVFNERPAWTADGLWVTFTSDCAEQGTIDLCMKRADGVDTAEVVLDLPGRVNEGFWSPDRAWIIYRATEGGEHGIFAWRAGPDSMTISVAAAAGVGEYAPTLSPDGRWLAYVSDETGRLEVWVRPFPDAGTTRWPVSAQGGTEPAWAHSGKELFYKNGHRDLAAVEVETQPTFRVVADRTLFSVANYSSDRLHRDYSVGANDQGFLMLRHPDPGGQGWVLVLNFFEELKQHI